MTDFLKQLTIQDYGSGLLYVIGAVFLYLNRFQLLYESGSLSLGRTWSWILFYLAVGFWIRYLLGIIPPTTPFPPGLENMMYVILLYEFAKKDSNFLSQIVDLIVNRRSGGMPFGGPGQFGGGFGGFGQGGFGAPQQGVQNQQNQGAQLGKTNNPPLGEPTGEGDDPPPPRIKGS